MAEFVVTTWNINSIRLRMPLVLRYLAQKNPDLICFQETKTADEFFPANDLVAAGYPHILFKGMKSYNGVAIASRHPMREISLPDWCGKQDCRAIAAKLADGTEIYNFYVPAGGDIPDPKQNEKFAHKLDFVREMTNYWQSNRNDKTRRIILGDFNIAPMEHDVWSHKQLLDVVSHTPIEVDLLNNMQAAHEWVDAVRHFVPPEQKLYSWWSYRARDWRASDRGRRLDHIWVTANMSARLAGYRIDKDARDWHPPSDHVPVSVALKT